MPPSQPTQPTVGGANSRISTTVDQQIASSNATANAFLGGRQPSWMTSGAVALKKPNPRPGFARPPAVKAVPQPQQQHPQQQHPPQQQAQKQPVVLPSPAPSDEPSPALSSTLDSPSTLPASLPDAHNPIATTSMSTPATLPVTDAPFVHDGYSNSPDVQEVSAPGAAVVPNALTSNHPLPPIGNTPQEGQLVHRRSLSLGGPPSEHGTLPSPKRRRTDQPTFTPVDFTSLLATLNSYIQSCGGDQALEPTVEKPRMMLLCRACRLEDEFFLVLHQLFSMWSQDPQQAHRCLPQGRQTIDGAFAILETVLKKNQLMSTALQQWFARFPVLPEQFSRGPVGGAGVLMEIATFLGNLAKEYESLTAATLHRGYPFLVDELLSRLGCASTVLQFILFTACRRRLGVQDDQLGNEMDTAFRKDQDSHRCSTSGRMGLAPITQPGQIEQRNAGLIAYFREIVTAATAARSSAQYSLRFPSVPGAPAPQQQAVLQDAVLSAQNTQHQQAVLTPSPIPNAFPSIYPSSAVPVPPQPSTIPVNPYAGQHVVNRPGSVQSGAQSNPQTPQLQLRTQPLPSSAQHHPTAGSYVTNQASQTPLPPYIPQQPQPMVPQPTVPQQQQAATTLQQFNQQQYQRTAQITGNYPVQVGFQTVPYPASMFLRTQPPSDLQQRHLQQRHQLQQQLQLQQQQQQQQQQMHQTQPTQQMQQQQPVQQLHNMQWTQQAQLVAQSGRLPANGTQPVVSSGPRMPVQPTQQHILSRRDPQVRDPLLPPPGTVIPRPEWPYGPSDRKSIMMSLHQAHVRSPKRVTREGEKERLYQAVKTLPVGPTSLVPKNTMYQFRFEISEEQFALAATKSQACGNLLPVVEHYNGALRWRIRCCVAPASHEMPTEQQWATLDVSWPPNIFMTLNHQVLDVRRQPHNGKDLATEITDLVVCGTNVLNISCPDLRRESAQNRFLAVEMLETLSHSNVVKLIWSQGTIPEEETLATIKKRLASPTDDEVSFGEPDLSIDLADPFSATIFKLPARGVDCTHMECFDLETWLNTRPSKPPIKCPHRQARCTCPNTPEPSNPDKWRCPICSKDARPYSLRIDGFLLKVRAQLEAEGKLQTKSMRVRADGSWSVVLETDDDGGSDGEGSRARSASAAAASSAQTSLGRKGTTQPTSSTGPRREVEVIEID